jgi:hypothetical protein
VRVHGLIYDVFVIAAFAGWVVGTTPMVRDLVGLSQAEASFITIVVAFGLARIDAPLALRFERHDDAAAGASTPSTCKRPSGQGPRRGRDHPTRDGSQLPLRR